MKTQYTPGPWFSDCNGFGGSVVTHNHQVTGHICNICIVQGTGAKTEVEGKANARLISLAPEMADTLRSLVSLCPSKEGLGGHAPIGAFIQIGESARALLAKLES